MELVSCKKSFYHINNMMTCLWPVASARLFTLSDFLGELSTRNLIPTLISPSQATSHFIHALRMRTIRFRKEVKEEQENEEAMTTAEMEICIQGILADFNSRFHKSDRDIRDKNDMKGAVMPAQARDHTVRCFCPDSDDDCLAGE